VSAVHLDFEAALLLATLVTGVLWALDKYLWAKRRSRDARAIWPVEFSRSFFPVILAVLLLRSFVVEPFRIPSSSMVPTLLEGDFILVNKFQYGLRLPVWHHEFLDLDAPERGDVAVFRYPPDPSKDFIKRVVGLPGDEIVYRDKQLYINGEAVPTKALGDYDGPGIGPASSAALFLERLGDVEHELVVVRDRRSLNLRAEVPAGHYFVMGDNRDNSSDSRRWGFVSREDLVGRAFLIWMSVDTQDWQVRIPRLGNLIH